MSSQIIAALIGLLGVVLGALPTYLCMRQRNLAEVDKLRAETDKFKAETQKIHAELQPSRVVPVDMQTTEEQEDITVLSATYGKGETRKDVTGIIKTILSAARIGHASLVVENENLGGDPLKKVEKELVIVYLHAGERHTRIISEHKELSLP